MSFWRQPISTKVGVAVVMFMVLNLIDAFCTLYAISIGVGEEINPIMRILLVQGPFIFLTVKYLMVAVAIVGIAAYCYQYRAARWALFYALLPVYLLTATYQLVMLGVVVK
ncbi:MAG: DUF5658 family protein [Patescibacteria group bacterium]